MPGVKASDAAGEVDHPVAIDVFDDRAFRLVDKDRSGMKCPLHHRGIAPLHQRL